MFIVNKRYFKSKNILILTFIGLIILPALLMTLIILHESTTYIKSNIITHSQEMLEQVNVAVEKEADQIESYITRIIYSDKTLEYINQLETASNERAAER
ncbi:hypothetical protein [Paenibacillus sp.]|uniref:hypothetical protein n=1 Tax=Paenibacillus sp. TaxID=58172 RepID=UPI0028AE8B2A|nr:hypothetical protein [Paenibacillus sp.]